MGLKVSQVAAFPRPMTVFSRWLGSYERWLLRRPWIANASSAAVLGIGGDVMCQFGFEEKTTLDTKRCAILTGFVAWYHGILCQYVYGSYDLLRRRLPAFACSSLLRVGIWKAGVDCLVHLPSLYVPSFYMWTGVLEGRGVHESWETLRSEWWEGCTSCLIFWGPVDVLMFSVIPQHFRIVFMSTGCLVWNGYLSYCAGKVKLTSVEAQTLALPSQLVE